MTKFSPSLFVQMLKIILTCSLKRTHKRKTVHHSYCIFYFFLGSLHEGLSTIKNISLIFYHFQIIVLFQFQDHMAVDTWRSYRSLHVLHGRQSGRVPEV